MSIGWSTSWGGCSVTLPGGHGVPLAMGEPITKGDDRKRARVDHAQRRRDARRKLAREQARALLAEANDG